MLRRVKLWNIAKTVTRQEMKTSSGDSLAERRKLERGKRRVRVAECNG